MKTSPFSLRRLWAMVAKEFRQMRRDRVTLGMIIGIPLMQLILFGYAINTDPKHLSTAVLAVEDGPFVRSIVAGMQTSRYFRIVEVVRSEDRARELLSSGQVQFVLNVPPDFHRRLVRGLRPQLLLQADATDPSAVSHGVMSLGTIVNQSLARDLDGPLGGLSPGSGPVEVVLHRLYNPEAKTQLNIVPGLMGVVLTMTMVIITSLAVTRESERGTMENLLTTPVRPLEVMLGKLMPYILVGYIQVGLIVLAGRYLFAVPIMGSLVLLFAVALLFIAANLAVGLTFSTVARNQLQAVQLSFFFFLPSIMLSGFMFPFNGMPGWAQWIGQVLPLTHFLRLVRGILLKGNGLDQAWDHLWPMALFLLVVMSIGLKRYRQTLD